MASRMTSSTATQRSALPRNAPHASAARGRRSLAAQASAGAFMGQSVRVGARAAPLAARRVSRRGPVAVKAMFERFTEKVR